MITSSRVIRWIAPVAATVLAACGGPARSSAEPIPGGNEPHLQGPPEPIDLNLDVRQLEEDTITLDRASGLEARRMHAVEGSGDERTWYGSVGEHGAVLLTAKRGEITGCVQADDARYRVVSQRPGRQRLIRLPKLAKAYRHPDSFREVEKRGGAADLCTGSGSTNKKTIDLIVAYTPTVKAATESEGSDIEALIDCAIGLANVANQNSEVNITFQLADAFVTADNENPDLDTSLNWFQAPGDNHFDEVHRLRDQYHADIAVLVMDGSGTYGGTTNKIMASAPEAFAVVDYRYLDGDYTFAHEIGHLMGLRHAPDDDSQTKPCRDDHGYRHVNGSHDTWGDIMVSDCEEPCQVIPYWSNPNVLYHGEPTGTVADSNGARMLNAAAQLVSDFR